MVKKKKILKMAILAENFEFINFELTASEKNIIRFHLLAYLQEVKLY